ncbi:MAG: hypothetical protein IKW08_06740 [Roseburia sp.]|nr:hypothetical protein [Roseburia sp.]
MDIKEIIENIVEEITKNKNLKEEFEKEPVKVIERIANVDLPDELVEKVVDGVKAKLTMDKVADIADTVSGLAGSLKKLF